MGRAELTRGPGPSGLASAVISVDIEFALVGLTAMVEPATLLASVLALVVGARPLRIGSLFYVGGLGITLLVGVVAAFVVGSVAASETSTPKTWVSVVTLVAGAALCLYGLGLLFRSSESHQMAAVTKRMVKVASTPVHTSGESRRLRPRPSGEP